METDRPEHVLMKTNKLAMMNFTLKELSLYSLPVGEIYRVRNETPYSFHTSLGLEEFQFSERVGECEFVVCSCGFMNVHDKLCSFNCEGYDCDEFSYEWCERFLYKCLRRAVASVRPLWMQGDLDEILLIPCSKEWFLYLKKYDFDIVKLMFNLPWHQPDLGFMRLLLSGDVELNPGPVFNFSLKNHLSLKRKIVDFEWQRKKTLKSKLRYIKQKKFKFQMFDDLHKLFSSPSVQRTMGYAVANFAIPGAGTAAATVLEGSKLIGATEKVSEAAQELADTCKSRIPQLVDQHLNLTSLAEKTLHTVNEFVNKFSSQGGLCDVLSTFLTGSLTVLSLIVTIVMIFVAFSCSSKIMMAIIGLVLLYFKWPTEIYKYVQTILQSFSFQSSEGYYHKIGQIIFALLSYSTISVIPSDRFYDNMFKRLDSIPKAVSGAIKIWEQAGTIFDVVSDEFKVYILGYQRDDLSFEKVNSEKVEQWVSRVKYYLDAKQKNLLARDEESVREVEQLFHQMYRWKHTPSLWKALSSESQRIITSVTPLVNELFKYSCRSTVHEGGPRRAPLALFLTGDSGRGKSELLYPLAFSLLAHRGCDMTNARNEVYVRNYETEYWDGYVGQKICLFDDAFQMRDSPGNPSPEWMEAVRLINTAPAHVHCADVNDKGRFFSSEICIYTCNLQKGLSTFINCVHCPEAVLRRLNALAYRVKTNPKFEKVMCVSGQEVRRLDPTLIAQCEECIALYADKQIECRFKFCPHVQLFDRYDIITDQVLESNMSYSQFVKQVKDYDRVMCKKEEDKLSMYEYLVENPYIFEMNDEEIFQDAEDMVLPLDLSLADDLKDYQDLTQFVWKFQSVDPDTLMVQIAYCARMWRIYQRVVKSGMVINFAPQNQIVPEQKVIIRSHETVFERCYNAFCVYMTKLRDVWNHGMSYLNMSNVMQILSYIALSLTIVSIACSMYAIFLELRDDVVCDKSSMCLSHGYPLQYSDGQHSFCMFCLKHKNLVELQNIKDLDNQQFKVESDVRPLNVKSKQFKVESDVRPLNVKPKQFKVESDVKPLNVKPKQFKVESDVKPLNLKQKQFKVESEENVIEPVLEMYADQGCEMLETKVLNRSMYLLHDDVKPLGNVLFVQGTIFLMNWHYLKMLSLSKKDKDILYFSNRNGIMMETTFGHLYKNSVRLEKSGDQVDAVLCFLDPIKSKSMPHVSIVKNFIDNADLSNLQGNYSAQLPTYNSSIDDVIPTKRTIVNLHMHNNSVVIDQSGINIEINQSWRYDGMTLAGDCGAPVIMNNNFAQRKIVGIHMASNGCFGMAQTITQQMLKKAISQIPSKYHSFVEIDLPIVEIDNCDQIDSVPMKGGLLVHGRVDQGVSSGNMTKIQPSKFYGYKEPLTMPALLKATEEHDPMNKGLIKYGKYVPYIDEDLVSVAVHDVMNLLHFDTGVVDVNQYMRVLTYEESLMGVPHDPYMLPINRSTSLGYPYVCKGKMRGKRDAFGDDEWTLTTELAQEIQKNVFELEECCRRGVQTKVYWSDTLKDERRPIEKVCQGKTRVFCGGPIHFTILFRKYFLGFAAWIMHNRNANEVSVGTNVYSHDWHEIVQLLGCRGRDVNGKINVVAGDFSNFDGSLSSQVLWQLLEIINDWYNDSDENKTIRRTLWMHIVHAMHLNRNILYQTTHSQPSGCPITAILNSLYNSAIMRIAYLICAQNRFELTGENFKNMTSFHKYVAMVSYGDDNLIAISPFIQDWFNQETITSALLKVGHEYTDESKTGLLLGLRDISEVKYLKRGFVWNDYINRYVAPLDLDVILEIVQWTKKGLMADAITLANLDVTMRELSLHPKEVFDHWSKILRTECVKLKINYRFLSQYEYLGLVCECPLLLQMDNTFTVVRTSRKLRKNYIYVDYRKRTLEVNKYNWRILRRLKVLCQLRGIQIHQSVDMLCKLFSIYFG